MQDIHTASQLLLKVNDELNEVIRDTNYKIKQAKRRAYIENHASSLWPFAGALQI